MGSNSTLQFPTILEKRVDLTQRFSFRRSLRRGSTTQARNKKVPKDVVVLNNRWRSQEHARGRFAQAVARVDEPAVIPANEEQPSSIPSRRRTVRPSVTAVPCDDDSCDSVLHPLTLYPETSPLPFPSPTGAFRSRLSGPPGSIPSANWSITANQSVAPTLALKHASRKNTKRASLSPKTPRTVSVSPDPSTAPIRLARAVPLTSTPPHVSQSPLHPLSLGFLFKLVVVPLLVWCCLSFSSSPFTFLPNSFVLSALSHAFVTPFCTLVSWFWQYVFLLPALVSWFCGALFCLFICPALEYAAEHQPLALTILLQVRSLIAACSPSHLEDQSRWSPLIRPPTTFDRIAYAVGYWWWRSAFWCWFGCFVQEGRRLHHPYQHHPWWTHHQTHQTHQRQSPHVVRAKKQKKRQWHRRRNTPTSPRRSVGSPGSGPTISPSPRPRNRRRVMTPSQLGICVLAAMSKSNTLTAALVHPTKLSNAMPKESTYNILWDSGASVSMSNCEKKKRPEYISKVL